MNGLAEFLETNDFKNLVMFAGHKYLKPLRISPEELFHEVRINMWCNLNGRDLNIKFTTATCNHTRYTVAKLFKKMNKNNNPPKSNRRDYISNKFEEDVQNEELAHKLLGAKGVTSREREMLRLRLDGETLDEIKTKFNCSKERVRQITNSAISKMRKSYARENYATKNF